MEFNDVELVPALLLGLLIGSFMNVLIYRLPREQSVVGGRSKCPGCRKQISWYDNIPVLSYAILRGRCRRCKFRIPWTYPMVEVLSGAIAVFVVYRYGLSLKAAWIFFFLASMLVITLVDWSHKVIPDSLSVGGIVFGWVGRWFVWI